MDGSDTDGPHTHDNAGPTVAVRKRHCGHQHNRVVVHAHAGMIVKAPWEQYMVHMRAYPFKGKQFHGHNPQSWILYVLNTFSLAVGVLDPLNPQHHH